MDNKKQTDLVFLYLPRVKTRDEPRIPSQSTAAKKTFGICTLFAFNFVI